MVFCNTLEKYHLSTGSYIVPRDLQKMSLFGESNSNKLSVKGSEFVPSSFSPESTSFPASVSADTNLQMSKNHHTFARWRLSPNRQSTFRRNDCNLPASTRNLFHSNTGSRPSRTRFASSIDDRRSAGIPGNGTCGNSAMINNNPLNSKHSHSASTSARGPMLGMHSLIKAGRINKRKSRAPTRSLLLQQALDSKNSPKLSQTLRISYIDDYQRDPMGYSRALIDTERLRTSSYKPDPKEAISTGKSAPATATTATAPTDRTRFHSPRYAKDPGMALSTSPSALLYASTRDKLPSLHKGHSVPSPPCLPERVISGNNTSAGDAVSRSSAGCTNECGLQAPLQTGHTDAFIVHSAAVASMVETTAPVPCPSQLLLTVPQHDGEILPTAPSPPIREFHQLCCHQDAASPSIDERSSVTPNGGFAIEFPSTGTSTLVNSSPAICTCVQCGSVPLSSGRCKCLNDGNSPSTHNVEDTINSICYQSHQIGDIVVNIYPPYKSRSDLYRSQSEAPNRKIGSRERSDDIAIEHPHSSSPQVPVNETSNNRSSSKKEELSSSTKSIDPALLASLGATDEMSLDIARLKPAGTTCPVKWAKAAPMSVSGYEMVELLAPAERECCSILRLFPEQYLVIKQALVRAGRMLPPGTFKKRDAQKLCRVDVNKTSKVFEWFAKLGWIPQVAGKSHSR